MVRHGRRGSLTWILATAAVVAGVLPALAARPVDPGPSVSPRTFTIVGDVDGLYPGAETAMVVTVTNDAAQPLLVSRVRASVDDASSACPGTVVEVDPFDGAVTVPARSTSEVPLTFRMLPSAPDACRGATFPVTYTGEGGKG